MELRLGQLDSQKDHESPLTTGTEGCASETQNKEEAKREETRSRDREVNEAEEEAAMAMFFFVSVWQR